MKQSFISKLSLKGAEDLLLSLKAKLTADKDMWEDRDWRTETGYYNEDHDENARYNLGVLVDLLDDYFEDGDIWRHRYDF